MTFAEVQRYPSLVMDETPRRYDPVTGEMVPITPYDFDFNRPLPEFRAPAVNIDDELLSAALEQLRRELGGISSGPYRGGASMEEIGTYKGGAEVVPLELAAGRSGFSTPKADKQLQIDKYFKNIRWLREKGILPTPKAEADDSYLEDVKLAGLVGYEDWTGPKEHGPFPDIFKSKGINQKGLKSLMEEMQEYRRRGVL